MQQKYRYSDDSWVAVIMEMGMRIAISDNYTFVYKRIISAVKRV
jgi:hypothetical protein